MDRKLFFALMHEAAGLGLRWGRSRWENHKAFPSQSVNRLQRGIVKCDVLTIEEVHPFKRPSVTK
ncbi:MAG: hypothetical protein ACI9TH_000080 [Kiritimatiellia bacterium]|jgi:hypothetical protein